MDERIGAEAMAAIVAELAARRMTVACAESLTGGLLADAFVRVPGASQVFRGGVCAYAADAKASVLGVDADRLASTGPVDEGVALEMARGVRRMFGADVALATTGVAGPGPADGHEAGTVWVAVDSARGSRAALARFPGGREDVRRAPSGGRWTCCKGNSSGRGDRSREAVDGLSVKIQKTLVNV